MYCSKVTLLIPIRNVKLPQEKEYMILWLFAILHIGSHDFIWRNMHKKRGKTRFWTQLLKIRTTAISPEICNLIVLILILT